MPRGLLGAAPGSAPPHAAAPGNSRPDCHFGPAASSGASPHVWALDPMAPKDDAASAIYLGSSLYRIHGSNEPDTIGAAVSSGCIRMTNQDVVDLSDRVRVGTKVVVIR